MIFPFLGGILNFRQAPVTWLLVMLQVSIFLHTNGILQQSKYTDNATILRDKDFLLVQGSVYAKHLLRNSRDGLDQNIYLARQAAVLKKDVDLMTLGQLAFRDPYFTATAEKPLDLDAVAFAWWQKHFTNVKQVQMEHPHYILGVGAPELNFRQWITYQFVHSNAMHLLSNMIFLLIFGAAVESLLGGLALLITFLGAGLFSAGAFLYFQGASAIPLIGASGGVSGIIGLICCLYWRKGLRYIYFLFIPKPGYAGFVFLPGWLAFMLFLVADSAGFLASGTNFGGVAHMAHMGGQMTGLVVGVSFFVSRTWFFRSEPWPTSDYLGEAKPFTHIS